MNKLIIKILDDKFNPIDSNKLLFYKEKYKYTINIITKLNSYKSLLNHVDGQELEQGGLRLDGSCPIRELLEIKGHMDTRLWGHLGDLAFYKPILKRIGFVPFWQMIYLSEALENEGIKTEIHYDKIQCKL